MPTLRPLTTGERALAHEVFAADLDAARVRLLAVPYWSRAFVASGRLVVWPARAMRPDFSAADVPLSLKAVFVHELTHVWQAQNGVSLLLGKLRAGDSPKSYAYDLAAGAAFADLNIEQQAMVVQHAFLLRHGGQAPFPAEAYAAVLPAWRRG
jgi:hypothetical protein